MEKLVKEIKSGNAISIYSSEDSFKVEDYFTIKKGKPEPETTTFDIQTESPILWDKDFKDEGGNSELERLHKQRVDAIDKKYADTVLFVQPSDGAKPLPSWNVVR